MPYHSILVSLKLLWGWKGTETTVFPSGVQIFTSQMNLFRIRGRRRVNNTASFFLQNLYNMKILALSSLSVPVPLSPSRCLSHHHLPPTLSFLSLSFLSPLWSLWFSLVFVHLCPRYCVPVTIISDDFTHIYLILKRISYLIFIFPKLTLFLAETFRLNQSATLVRAFHHLLSS